MQRRTEAMLERCPNNNLAEAISKDKRRREDLRRQHSSSGKLLNRAAFTDFMGNFHDQNQVKIPLKTKQGTRKGRSAQRDVEDRTRFNGGTATGDLEAHRQNKGVPWGLQVRLAHTHI